MERIISILSATLKTLTVLKILVMREKWRGKNGITLGTKTLDFWRNKGKKKFLIAYH